MHYKAHSCRQFSLTSIRLKAAAGNAILKPIVLAGLVLLAAWPGRVVGQAINVPNGSFELESGAGQPFGVNVLVDSWQKADKPAYFDAIEQNYGIFWPQTAGVFVDTNPYGNRTGTQAGYILPFPQVSLFEDYDTIDYNDPTPSHAFDATYDVGKAYNLTLGVFGKGMAEGNTLALSLYYRDASSNQVTVGSTTIAFSTNTFVNVAPLDLVDFTVSVPTVQASDAWAGKHIGILIESLTGDGSGNWDFDNVRLTAVPEPSATLLAALGLGGWLWWRRWAGRRH